MTFFSLPKLNESHPGRWFEWIQALEMRAWVLRAWHLVDPSPEDNPADALEPPVTPDRSEINLFVEKYLPLAGKLSSEDRSRAQFTFTLLKGKKKVEWREFDVLWRRYQEQKALLDRIGEMIVVSVESSLMIRSNRELSNTWTIRQLVRKLKGIGPKVPRLQDASGSTFSISSKATFTAA